MTIRVAINGFGRIGRNILRALYEAEQPYDIQVVAINGPADLRTTAHLLRHDTVHGRFSARVETEDEYMLVNGDRIRMLSDRNPANLPWGDLGVDVVLECTGAFNSRTKSAIHLEKGAKKVILSAPGGTDVDATVVYGVNHHILKSSDTIISNASCTTNCLAPLVQPLHQGLGVVHGLMTTIHAYTNDQVLTDVHHKDLRRARSATQSMIPTKTGAASSVGLVLPELAGRLDGYAIRVPTINVSLVDLTFVAGRETSAEEVNEILQKAAEGPLKGILDYSTEPLVSIDYNHTAVSGTVDSLLTKVTGPLVKVSAWYDNEWGFSNRMLDTTVALMSAQ